MPTINRWQQLVTTLYGGRLGFNPDDELVVNGDVVATQSRDSSGNFTGLVGGNGSVIRLSLPMTGTSASSVADTTMMQTALNGRGTVEVKTPGTYQMTYPAAGTVPLSTLVAYDDTELRLGAGVVLKQAANQGKSLIRNSNYASTIKSVSAITCATASMTGYRRATATATAHGFSVGNYVLIKGDTSASGAGTYNGIWLVDTVPDANTFTFYFMNTADGASASGTVTAALANANIVISGPGRVDYNRMENATFATGTDQLALVLNKVKNCHFRNLEVYNGAKYMMHFSNAVDCSFDGIEANTGSDVCHVKGPSWNIRANDISGQAGDDMVAFVTVDVLDATINPPDTGGDIRDICVTNVQDNHSNVHRCVVVAPNAGHVISGVKIDGVQCMGVGYIAVQFCTNLTESGTVIDADVRNISGGFGTAASGISPVLITGPSSTGTLTVGNIMVDGVKCREASSYHAVTLSGRLTFSEVSIKNVKQRPLSLEGVVLATGSSVVGDVLNVEDVRMDSDATNAAARMHVVKCASSNIKRTRISRASINSNGGTTRSSYFYQVFSPGANNRFEVVDSEINAAGGSFAELSTITNAPTLYARGVTVNAASNYFQSCSENCTLIASDIDVITLADFLIIAGTSKTVNLQMSNIRLNGQDFCTNYGTTNTINWTGGDGSCNVNFDATKFTFANGAVFYNTNAAFGAGIGLYGYGPGGATRLAA